MEAAPVAACPILQQLLQIFHGRQVAAIVIDDDNKSGLWQHSYHRDDSPVREIEAWRHC